MKYPEHKHCSPDGLVGEDGMIEIKVVIPSTFVELKAIGKIDTDYRRQMQWGMWICDRQWCDFVVYCPAVGKTVDPLIIIRVERDEKEIEELNEGADKFVEDLQTLLAKIMKG